MVVENEASLTIGSKCDKAVTVKHEDFFVAGTDYYAVVAPFEAGGITVKSVAVGRSAERTSATPITLERNKGLNLGNVTEKVTWKYSQIWDAEQLVDFLAGADTYTEDDVVTVCSDLNLAGVELVGGERHHQVVAKLGGAAQEAHVAEVQQVKCSVCDDFYHG